MIASTAAWSGSRGTATTAADRGIVRVAGAALTAVPHICLLCVEIFDTGSFLICCSFVVIDFNNSQFVMLFLEHLKVSSSEVLRYPWLCRGHEPWHIQVAGDR